MCRMNFDDLQKQTSILDYKIKFIKWGKIINHIGLKDCNCRGSTTIKTIVALLSKNGNVLLCQVYKLTIY